MCVCVYIHIDVYIYIYILIYCRYTINLPSSFPIVINKMNIIILLYNYELVLLYLDYSNNQYLLYFITIYIDVYNVQCKSYIVRQQCTSIMYANNVRQQCTSTMYVNNVRRTSIILSHMPTQHNLCA